MAQQGQPNAIDVVIVLQGGVAQVEAHQHGHALPHHPPLCSHLRHLRPLNRTMLSNDPEGEVKHHCHQLSEGTGYQLFVAGVGQEGTEPVYDKHCHLVGGSFS